MLQCRFLEKVIRSTRETDALLVTSRADFFATVG